MDIPSNLRRLHQFEEDLRLQVLAGIDEDEESLWHLNIIEQALGQLNLLSFRAGAENEDQVTVQLLGIRTSNSIAACLRLLSSGYSQGAVMLLRDAFETALLIDYLHIKPELIGEWRAVDPTKRYGKFKPSKLRNELDSHNGDASGRRKLLYETLCNYGAHPSYEGIALTRSDDGIAQWGPFHRHSLIAAILYDAALVSMECAFVVGRHVEVHGSQHLTAQIKFYENVSLWVERFRDTRHDATRFEDMYRTLGTLRALELDERTA